MTRKKMSKSQRERCSEPSYRILRSQLTKKQWENPIIREKMRLAQIERYKDPEERRKTGKYGIGRIVSEETKEKLRTAHKKRFEDPGVRKAARECKLGEKNPMFGKHISEETRKKISASLKGHQISEETRRKIGERSKGRACSLKGQKRPEVGIKISLAKKGKTFSKEHCKKLSEARIKIIEKVSGKNHPNWKGGISYEPYCPKFNNEFRERVRKYFNYKCLLCGKSQEENKRRLDVHHVNYDKRVCCNNQKPLFAPLCVTCHRKTGFNREYWETILENKIMLEYDGDCYTATNPLGDKKW